jgi:AcrR family transcriptional regulator
MQKVMRDTAIRLMQGGQVPSVSDVAEAAEVSRATAYRYFPTQAAIIQAAVNEALGPILEWSSDSDDARERVLDLVESALPRLFRHEATHRAALRLALEQWARRQSGLAAPETRVVRGNRKALLAEAAEPMRRHTSRQTFEKLLQSLSLLFGVEAIIVLKDIWGLDEEQARGVVLWATAALIEAAESEAPAPRRAAVKSRSAVAPRRARK